MTPLRQLYSHLVAEHAAGHSGELVTEFSDKGTQHSYIEFYEGYFEPHRAVSSILEIGVMTGASQLLWQQYFDSVTLTGIDLRQGFNKSLPFQSQLTHTVWHWGVDSTDAWAVPDLDQHQFVIDDGAHDLTSQICTLKNYWKFVKPGGTYFIEDIENNDNTQALREFISSWCQEPHRVDYYRGYTHRVDDRILAVTRGTL